MELRHNAGKLIIVTLHILELSSLNCGVRHPPHIILAMVHQRGDGDSEAATRLTLVG
jgi:hypothetical protein